MINIERGFFPLRLEFWEQYLPFFRSRQGTGARAGAGQKTRAAAPFQQPANALRINRVYIAALAISLAFLTCGGMFILYSSQLSRDETIAKIQTSTRQTTRAIEEHIAEEFATLMAASMAAENQDLLAEDEALLSLMKGLCAYNAYVAIGFADTKRQAVWLDQYGRQYRSGLLNEDFIDQALTNKKIVSGARWDEIVGMKVNFYAVPVYNPGTNTVKGALIAADPEDELRTVIRQSLYAGQGLAHIIDRNGKYVLKSGSPLVPHMGSSIFSPSSPADETMREQILTGMAAGETGYMERPVNGENWFVSYGPLDINDWYVFYAVPEDRVNAGLRSVTLGAMTIIVMAMAVFASLILLIRHVNGKGREALETLAFVDPVTGGANYSKFLQDATAILRKAGKTNYALTYIDIEGFRYINDLLGREEGDRLLRYWANHLQEITREGETFCRINGDIFVTLRRYKNRQEIDMRFMSLVHHLAVYPEILSRGYKVEIACGVYLTGETDERLGLNDMLDRAITAQKTVKGKSGKKRLGYYSREMREQKLWEAEVEASMDGALENREFHLYLQPKIAIQDGDRIMGAEALVRWISPEKGTVPPGRFIDLFERNNFIVKLDRHVFEAACRHYRETVLEGSTPPYILSVNVSKLSLMQPDFSGTYAQIKDRFELPDGCMELEFTESLVFENHALLQSIVADCKRRGFLCSLDDFGAGYSSLNLLKSLYVDSLKLDRLFFQCGDDIDRGRKLVQNIVAMAKALDMKIVAEGIEMPHQVEQLRDMGCDAIQGYVFAKPMPVEDFTHFCGVWQRAKDDAVALRDPEGLELESAV